MSIISDKKEQDSLRRSGLILGSCLIHLGEMLKPGVNAAELNLYCLDFFKKYDAKAPFLGYMGFPHALCTSVNHEVVHGLSDKTKVFKVGDVVSFDLGVYYKGFITDSARTFLVTTSGSDDLSHVFDEFSQPETTKQFFSATSQTATEIAKQKLIVRTETALIKALDAIKAGARIGDIGAAVGGYVSGFGYGNVTALGGHGVGRAVHEPPYISNIGKKGTGNLLVENMVLAIEPMITMGGGKVKFVPDPIFKWDEVVTTDHSIAAHFEDTILVTKKGCEIITRIPKEQVLP